MLNENKNILDDATLKAVSGGAGNTSEFIQKRDDFEKAWVIVNMEGKGYTGMDRAEMFDAWEAAGYQPDATTFLLSK